MTEPGPPDPPPGDHPSTHEIDQLAARLRNPSSREAFELAARDWHDLMFRLVFSRVRKTVGGRLVRRMDHDDLVQSAFKSFYRVLPNYDEASGRELRALLMAITENKCRDRLDRELAECRDVRRDETPGSRTLERAHRLPSPRHPKRIRPGKDDGTLASNKAGPAADNGLNGEIPMTLDYLDASTARRGISQARCSASGSGPHPSVVRVTIPSIEEMTCRIKSGATAEQTAILEETLLALPESLLPTFLLCLEGRGNQEIATVLGTYRKRVAEQKSIIGRLLLAEYMEHGTMDRLNENDAG